MPIEFNQLPTEAPEFVVPEPGIYQGTVTKAEMRKSKKNPEGPEYLNMTIALVDPTTGQKKGNIFDSLFETDAPLLRYKLGQFLRAINLNLTGGAFELKDICKLIKDKPFLVDITNKPNYNNPEKDDAVVNVMDSQIFWPMSELGKLTAEKKELDGIFGTTEAAPVDDAPFDAADGVVPTGPLNPVGQNPTPASAEKRSKY